MVGPIDSEGSRRLRALAELKGRAERRRYDLIFPDETIAEGPDGDPVYARDLYPRHLEFFEMGATHRERCFMAGNRVGKTEAGGFEVTAHATGRYKPWWPGRRFRRPTRIWAAGKTAETTRDTVQRKLFGAVTDEGGRKRFDGTGMVPFDCIGPITWKSGISDFADTVQIRHVSGGWSIIGLKSYNQGRGAFEGTEQHAIWLDEEPPQDVYGECLIRTATTNGLVLLTFTPLEGISDVVKSFMPQDVAPGHAA